MFKVLHLLSFLLPPGKIFTDSIPSFFLDLPFGFMLSFVGKTA